MAGALSLPSPAVAAEKTPNPARVVKFVPGKINKSAVGKAIPADAKLHKAVPSSLLDKAGEEVERRTEKSRTVVTEDGRYETQFHDVPIHFQDALGKWQRIDNKLVPSSVSGYAVRNSAGDASVQLPKSLAQTPARLEREGRFVQFSLKGAQRPAGQVGTEQQQALPESQPVPPQPEQTQIAPSPEQPAVGDAPASPESSTQYGADAVVPDNHQASPTPAEVPVRQADGVPAPPVAELPGSEPGTTPAPSPTAAPAPTTGAPPAPAQAPAAPLAPPAGEPGMLKPKGVGPQIEDAKATYQGVFDGVDVIYTVTNQGLKEDLILAGPQAPTIYDFALQASPDLTAKQTSSGGIDLVEPSGAVWAHLQPPYVHDASFPGKDPLQGISGSAVTMKIVATSPELIVRLAVEPSWLDDPARQWPVTVDPTVSWYGGQDSFITSYQPSSNFDYHPWNVVNGSSTPYRTLYKPDVDMASYFTEPVEVISAAVNLWANNDTTGQATQPVAIHEVTRDWTAPEATWNQRRTGSNWIPAGGAFKAQAESINPNATGPAGQRQWEVTRAVRSWVNEGKTNHGFILKFVNDSLVTPTIGFNSHQAAEGKPYLTVSWQAITAVRSPYSYQSFSLGERREAMVNLASGNLNLKETDMSISGTGLDTGVQRTYASREGYKKSIGARWAMWPQSAEKLFFPSTGDVQWHGGPEWYLHFTKNPDGSYKSPHGYRATLALAAGTYTLTMHETGLKYLFDSGGYPKEIVDQNNNKITFGYIWDAPSDRYWMSSMTDTQGRATTFERLGPNQVSKVTDPAGRIHRYEYEVNSSGHPQLTSYIDPAGKQTDYEYVSDIAAYQPTPPLSKIIEPNGNVTTFGYTDVTRTPITLGDAANPSLKLTRLTRVTDPATGSGPTWFFDYSTPWQTKVTDPNNHTSTHYFDRLGRVTKLTDHLGKSTETHYGANGFVDWVSDQAGAKTSLAYDGMNNRVKATSPSGASQQAWFDDTAQDFYPSKAMNAQGNAMNFGYDAKGNSNMRQSQLPADNMLSAEYNPNGTVKLTKDGMGNLTNFEYYTNGNLHKVLKPLGVGNMTYEYDGLSRVTKATDAKGQATEYSYDALDRVTETKFAGGSSIVSVYDDAGRLIRRDDKAGPGLLDPVETTTFGYDRLNRQTTKTVGGVTFSSTFDGVGNLKSISDSAGTVGYEYDAVDRLMALVEPGGARTSFGYDSAYRRNLISYPNGVTQTTVYDADGKVTSMVGRKGDGSVLTTFGYDYKKPGGTVDTSMVYKMTDPSGVTNYSYDQMERLTQAAGPNGTFNYTLDGNANRTSSSVNGGPQTSYSVNAADQLTQAGSTTFQYDANGNLTGQSDGRTLGYNSKDQNISFKPAGALAQTTTMAYLGSGQTERTKAGASSFKNGPLGLAINSSGLLSSTNYVRTPEGELISQRTGANAHYYLFDRLGSVGALTDSSGNPVNRYFYDPFGNYLSGTTEAVANPWQFAGGFKDTFSGFYKFGGRYYDPTIGRWTQVDPSGQDANSYAYAGSNPVNFVDPTGLKLCRSKKCVKQWIDDHVTTNLVGCVMVCANFGGGAISGGAFQFARQSATSRAGAGVALYATVGTRKPGKNISAMGCGLAGGCFGAYWNWDDHGFGIMAGVGTPGVFIGPSVPLN